MFCACPCGIRTPKGGSNRLLPTATVCGTATVRTAASCSAVTCSAVCCAAADPAAEGHCATTASA